MLMMLVSYGLYAQQTKSVSEPSVTSVVNTADNTVAYTMTLGVIDEKVEAALLDISKNKPVFNPNLTFYAYSVNKGDNTLKFTISTNRMTDQEWLLYIQSELKFRMQNVASE